MMQQSATERKQSREYDIASLLNNANRLGLNDVVNNEALRDVINNYFMSDLTLLLMMMMMMMKQIYIQNQTRTY
jgi:hypothetical protein